MEDHRYFTFHSAILRYNGSNGFMGMFTYSLTKNHVRTVCDLRIVLRIRILRKNCA